MLVAVEEGALAPAVPAPVPALPDPGTAEGAVEEEDEEDEAGVEDDALPAGAAVAFFFCCCSFFFFASCFRFFAAWTGSQGSSGRGGGNDCTPQSTELTVWTGLVCSA